MPAQSRREFVAGAAGRIECAVDEPDSGAARGVALVAHPHPLYGGTLDNKVAQTLARAFVELGYAAWRPNFRGVGQSDGNHDEGRGELEDLLAVLEHAGARRPALAGFSFGAAIVANVAQRIEAERLVLVGLAVNRLPVPKVAADTLVIHGENDTTVPLAGVFDWARPQDLPVVVISGADHFFHRRLGLLRAIVKGNWK
ncbi:MAG: alpha/beta fold hydrolase [Betaproteobacteria bacterium]|nr:alpha/beta fold hydrolase [Betaproteobacteria bacterium]